MTKRKNETGSCQAWAAVLFCAAVTLGQLRRKYATRDAKEEEKSRATRADGNPPNKLTQANFETKSSLESS